MVDELDIERLIRRVTESVMARLGMSARSDSARNAWLLLPMPTGQLARLAGQTGQLLGSGYQVRVLAAREVMAELERSLGKGQFACPVEGIHQVNLSEMLAGLKPRDLIVVGSLGFELARATVDLADRNPWVRLISQALLKKLPVVMVTDDLAPVPGASGDRLAGQANDLMRGLAGLGLRSVTLDKLPAVIHGLAQAASTLTRATGGLVTETDVEQLVAQGEKRLVLNRRAIVTPLARSRALELGLEIVKEES